VTHDHYFAERVGFTGHWSVGGGLFELEEPGGGGLERTSLLTPCVSGLRKGGK
jgi:hypothetical protein